MAVQVQTAGFDPGQLLNALHQADAGVGAVVSFVGYMRDFNDGQAVARMLPKLVLQPALILLP